MIANLFVTLKDGKIIEMTDSSSGVRLEKNQIPCTDEEFTLIRLCNGDLEYAKRLIENIEQGIKAVSNG